jgi:UDP-N-acetylglucosamine 2-epimerase (non-hydrolysing)/GDP/UDP-N,N'-diacetylbacillosamine 2-epimerase (hydrolysing)
VTSSRADYGHCLPVVQALMGDARTNVRLLVTGAHLSPAFGMTVHEIERDGLPIDERLECMLIDDTDHAMSMTIGLATIAFADAFSRRRPDLLVIVADRHEMLAPASAALPMRIPIAHIEGGDVSEGAIDQVIRNALTMMSHLHFTPTALAAARLRSMGEESWRVHHVGTPSLDVLRTMTAEACRGHLDAIGLACDPPPLVIGMHSVTLDDDPTSDVRALFAALRDIDPPMIFCFPNADVGSRTIMTMTQDFCAQRPNAQVCTNLPPRTYWSLLHHALALVGNSSSGIMEAPALQLPSVNIGARQQGRERAASVIDVRPEKDAIIEGIHKATSQEFRSGLAGMVHPYGDGHTAQRIAKILAEIPFDARLLRKPAPPVRDDQR